MRFSPFLMVFALLAAGPAASATLEGKVVIDGAIPKLKARKKTYSPYAYKDKAPSKPAHPRHLLVYLEGVKGDFKPEKAPSLSQMDRDFVDDVVPVIRGGKVKITNDDTVSHHIRCGTDPWNFNLKPKKPGQSVELAFAAPKEAGAGVAPVFCDIHSNMRAHVVVLDNPFYQVLEETGGSFSLKGVPPGSYTLNAFHPTLKVTPLKVKVGEGKGKPVTLTLAGEK